MDSLHNLLGYQQSCNHTAAGPSPVPYADTRDSQQYSHSINNHILSEVQAILFERLRNRGDRHFYQESLRVTGGETRSPALWASIALEDSPLSAETLLNDACRWSGDTG